MRRWPLIALLLVLSCALSAGEPKRVELDLPRPDAKTPLVAAPLTGAVVSPAVIAPPSLPSVEAGLQQTTVSPEVSGVKGPEGGPLVQQTPQLEPKADAPGEARVEAGQVQFDQARAAGPDAVQAADAPAGVSLDEVVSRNASRPLRGGVFIQQEQEGSLLAADPRDSSGNVFRWYRPVEMRPGLVAEVHGGLGTFGKIGYGLKRSVNFWDKDPYKVWDAWPLSSKLEYLGKLEAAVTAEKGKDAAWKGKVSLILERKDGAPSFLTPNPHMENPPSGYEKTPGARFLQPELVSDKDHPASTINEAIGRSRMIIAETGHAGTQYHVFMKLEPARLRAQLPRLQSALQLVNDALFARAAQESFQNVEHPSLLPWHAGRSRRVAELIAAADAAPHTPQAEDADSEKHAFVGLRYWGMEGGKAVVSFELRGASIPWKRRSTASPMIRGSELDPDKPVRDYSQVQYYLTFLSLFAERLSADAAPQFSERPLSLDLARAEALLSARARERGIPEDAYYGVGDFARRLSGASEVPPGYLFPFAAADPSSPAFKALLDGFLQQSARVRAIERAGGEISGEKRNIEYMFWQDYAAWARSYESQVQPRFQALFRASAS